MRTLIAILIICAIGCEGEPGKTADGSNTSGTFTKCTYEGHDYIIYKAGFGNSSYGGLEHDPECRKCRK